MTHLVKQDGPIHVEFLYLDLEVCERCRGTDAALREAISVTRSSLEAMDLSVELGAKHITSANDARSEGLVASPTIRIDGRDIQPEAHQNKCQECGDLCGCHEGVDCRIWAWRGKTYTTAPVAMIVEALLSAALTRVGGETKSEMQPAPAGTLSGNLQQFFEAREQSKADGCRATGCCS